MVIGACSWHMLQDMHLNRRQSAAQKMLIRKTRTLKLIGPYFGIANVGYPRKYKGDVSE